MNFIERIKGLLFNPDKTMEDVAKEPRLEEAVVVIAIYAILYTVFTYIQTSKVKYVFTDSSMPDTSGFMMIISIVAALIMPFIIWVIISVILYLFSMVFGGEGKFTSVLTAIGYSALPKIFAIIIAAILLTQAQPVTVEISSSNPFASMAGATEFYKQSIVMLSSMVILAGVIWSSLIGMFGIKHTEKITMTSAAIVVGVPLALYVIMQLASYVL
jgi:hypothetical protein